MKQLGGSRLTHFTLNTLTAITMNEGRQIAFQAVGMRVTLPAYNLPVSVAPTILLQYGYNDNQAAPANNKQRRRIAAHRATVDRPVRGLGEGVMEKTEAAQLERVAAFEAKRRSTPVTRFLLVIGRTRGFARVYRVLGPAVDPWILRRSKGKVASQVYGLPALLLNTVGRRSAEPRVSPLVYIRDGDAFVVVGTNFGQHHHPAWTANLLAQPDAAIEVGPERLTVRAELVDPAGWERLWPRFVAIYPGYANYLHRSGGRTPRMFVLRPVG